MYAERIKGNNTKIINGKYDDNDKTNRESQQIKRNY